MCLWGPFRLHSGLALDAASVSWCLGNTQVKVQVCPTQASWRKGGDWLVHRLSSSWELRDFSPEEQYLELVVSRRVTHATENGVNTGGGRGAPA